MDQPAATSRQQHVEGSCYVDWQLIDLGPLSTFPEGPPALLADEEDVSFYVRLEQGNWVIRATDALLRPGSRR